MTKIFSPKKLIEVALPLDDINEAAAREKSIRHGHPSTLHLWWARRPLAAARAVIFAQMVNDPGYQQDGGFKYGVNKKEAEIKREKLFQIIRDLVKWENTNNEEVLNRAREAIKESWRETCHLNRNHPQAAELFNPEKLPDFHDPFAGGGTIPLEAQRLGLNSYASDLNPVAVMINKAMIEAAPVFKGIHPIGPLDSEIYQANLLQDWSNTAGLAEDVKRYGKYVSDRAYEKIGHSYSEIEITQQHIDSNPELDKFLGKKLTVIAWLWARTVKSPNPAFSDCDVPLVSSFVLAKKKGKDVYIEPVITDSSYKFFVRQGVAPDSLQKGTKVGRGGNFTCLLSNSPISVKEIREQGIAGKMGRRLLAIVLESPQGQVFLSPDDESEELENSIEPNWSPDVEINFNPRDIRTQLYGLVKYKDLFSNRQLNALSTFSDCIEEVREKIYNDALKNGLEDDGRAFKDGGSGARAYSDVVSLFLGLALGRCSNYWSSLTAWGGGFIVQTFGRQALPMVWDYSEVNPFSSSTGNWLGAIDWINRVIKFSLTGQSEGHVLQRDAQTQEISLNKVISTDPPYYDNICYADLSDYFYVWLRKTLKNIFPDNFTTITVPKSEELVASQYRHGGKEQSESFFLKGMQAAMRQLSQYSHPAFPATIYYAFRQTDTSDKGTSNTGWETFLSAVINAGFSVVGTWPMRTERDQGLKTGANFLASSIILVCHKKTETSGSITRRELQKELRDKMPEALEAMIGGELGATPIAPVDLAQAAIGPGMAIYSKYETVLNQDGSQMSVHDALILINKSISDYLNPDSGNFDADTLFCDDWFSQFGWSESPFGIADTLARAKGTSVDGVAEAGVIEAGAGKVRLLKWSEYPQHWDPTKDSRTPIWEACHHLIRTLNQQGEADAGRLLARMPERGEQIRQLAYHLYTICERKKWAEEARAYNELIGSWHAIVAASLEHGHKGTQAELGFDF